MNTDQEVDAQRCILSGGQTGVDQAALRAARAVGFETGGWAPLGWETEAGPAPWLADYGLVECPEPGYPARRRRVVLEADTMILIGDRKSPGSIGLLKEWSKLRLNAAYVWVKPGVSTPHEMIGFLRMSRRDGKPVETVMVAGNRGSKFPGIGERSERCLRAVFRQPRDGRPGM
jgi:hypothetical protein